MAFFIIQSHLVTFELHFSWLKNRVSICEYWFVSIIFNKIDYDEWKEKKYCCNKNKERIKVIEKQQ